MNSNHLKRRYRVMLQLQKMICLNCGNNHRAEGMSFSRETDEGCIVRIVCASCNVPYGDALISTSTVGAK